MWLKLITNYYWQEFQRQWEEIIVILYEAANNLFCRPYPYLMVVEDKEDDNPHFSGRLVHIEVIDTYLYYGS